MNKAKVVRGKARKFKASRRQLVSDSSIASMKRNAAEAPGGTFSIHHNQLYSPRTHADMKHVEHAARRYADLYDLAPTGYVSFHRSGQIAEINLTAEMLIGLPRDRLIGMPFAVFVHREDTTLFLHHLLRCRCSDGRVETDLRLKNAAHKLIPVQLCSISIPTSSDNGAVLFQTAIVDLTERKRFEETIRRSEKRYRTLFDLVPVAIYACDAYGSIQDYNQRAVELWGREPGLASKEQKFCGSHKIYYPDGRPMPHEECPMARVLHGEKLAPKDLEIVVERPDGERRHVIPAPGVLTDEQGKITGAINCLFDITDRKRAETAATRLAAAVESSHDAIAAKTLKGIITDWNQSAQRIFGYEPKEIIGKSVLTLIPKDRQSEEQEILRKIRRGESLDHYETVRRRKDGKLIDVSLTISPIKAPNGEIVGVSKIARDITKQKQTKRRLAEQARLLDLSNDAIIVRDHRDRIVYWNRGAEEMYGFLAKEALGKVTHKLLQTAHPENLGKILKNLERDGCWSGELVHTRKDGKSITVRINGHRTQDSLRGGECIEVIVQDVTEQILLEKHLREAQKFEAIGQLAGGIAHDFNNMIGAIMGWADIGIDEAEPDSRLRRHFEKVRQQAQRAAALTRQLLAFARRQILEPRDIDLNQSVIETLSLLEKVIGSNIEIKANLAPDLVLVRADPTQIEQVLMNLCINARDAMPNGGSLIIESANRCFDEKFCALRPLARPGQYAMICVSDTGTGIDEATLTRIFEPFFTTKEFGKGTGLGLATVYGIVQQHGGFIDVESKLGAGSAFRTYLPVSTVPRLCREKIEDVSSVKGGTETILLVEDHEGLRHLAVEVLTNLGYRVLAASDGEQALQEFSKHQSNLNLVILDVMLPKRSGPEIYARISAKSPDLPVIFATGYSADLAMLREVQQRGLPVLQKPYAPRVLARKVRETLDQHAGKIRAEEAPAATS